MQQACGAGFHPANTCLAPARLKPASLSQVTDTAPLKGRLYYLENNTKTYNIHNQVAVNVYNRNDKLAGPITLFTNGLFTVLNIPRFSSNNYIATIDITDAAGVFLQKKVDLLVPICQQQPFPRSRQASSAWTPRMASSASQLTLLA
jgi:hypothetical protein